MPDDGAAADAAAAAWPGSLAVPPSGRPALSRLVRMRFDRTRGRHVLLGPESVIVLNPTGADILDLCDGQRSVSDVAAALQERYDRVVDDEVTAFLSRLVSRRCVEIHDGP
jgi:pyrroloquinoline quinone biosynthesis protein D